MRSLNDLSSQSPGRRLDGRNRNHRLLAVCHVDRHRAGICSVSVYDIPNFQKAFMNGLSDVSPFTSVVLLNVLISAF